MAWYSGDPYEKASLFWNRAFEHRTRWAYWIMVLLQLPDPAVLCIKRSSAPTSGHVLIISIFVNIGMWFERFVIIVPSLGHDFYPYTWGIYVRRPPTP